MKTKPTSYLYNFYTKDDSDGAPIIIEIDGFKVQIGINVVILPGFHIKPCKERAGNITIIGSNSFLGKGEMIEEGSTLPEGTILEGEPMFRESLGISVMFAADDLGRKQETNDAIVDCFEKKLIHHASIMVNCPYFMDAVRQTKESPYHDFIGLHFNVLDGSALSFLERKGQYNMNWPRSFGSKMNSRRSAFFLWPREKKQLRDELQKQIDRFVSCGLKPRYFDSHGNIHFKYPVARVVEKIIKRASFSYVRPPRMCSARHPLYDRLFKRRVFKLYARTFETPCAFLFARDLFTNSLTKWRGQTLEVMVHPFIRNGKTINRRDVSFPTLLAFCKSCKIEILH